MLTLSSSFWTLAISTQLFWFKLLCKLTDSIWLLWAAHWIVLLGLKQTLASFFFLFIIFWFLILWLQLPLLTCTEIPELTNKLSSTTLPSLLWFPTEWTVVLSLPSFLIASLSCAVLLCVWHILTHSVKSFSGSSLTALQWKVTYKHSFFLLQTNFSPIVRD